MAQRDANTLVDIMFSLNRFQARIALLQAQAREIFHY